VSGPEGERAFDGIVRESWTLREMEELGDIAHRESMFLERREVEPPLELDDPPPFPDDNDPED
jgi:hypothetical protein